MATSRINEVRLRFGSRPESGPTTVELGPVTVLVGPNNGGKSRTLQDLQEYAGRGNQTPIANWSGGVILEAISVEGPDSLEEALAFLAPRTERLFDEGHQIEIRTFPFAIVAGGNEHGRISFPVTDVDPARTNPETVAAKLLGYSAIALNGRDRFNLASDTQTGPLDGPPTSHWMTVEREEEAYAKVNEMIHAAFERHLVIRTFRPPSLGPALSDDPLPAELRQSTGPEAVAFQRAATPLEALSDGVKVYCGMVAAWRRSPIS